MMPLAGYADRLSVRPGETIQFKVSSQSDVPYAARLVRVHCADPNPQGPGINEEAIESSFAGLHRSRVQNVHRGSYAIVENTNRLGQLGSFTLMATVFPTRIATGEQVIISNVSAANGTGLALALRGDGAAMAQYIYQSGALRRVTTGKPLFDRQWYRLWISYDQATHQLTLGQVALQRGRASAERAITAEILDEGPTWQGASVLTIAAMNGTPTSRHFNGKIERPMLFGRALSQQEIELAANREKVSGLVAAWDFANEMSSTRILDEGPNGLHGRLVNLPARAMTGSTWTGREMCWRHAPDQYAAIHFHDDDLYDCGWGTDFVWQVPDNLPSGAYAVRLNCGEAEENIPFFVVPPKGTRKAEICVLISTFTYVVYHNFVRPEWLSDPSWVKAWRDQARTWKAYPHNPGDHPEYGRSTYNYHSDGSGICHASWLRPMLTLRTGFISFPDPSIRGSGLRHFPADTHLLSWLEAKGYEFDIVTDLELDEEGADLLRDYRVVVTGSHPEYHTPNMLDALEAYRDSGGRLMYMGGNGFYWKIARHPELKAAIEIRRAEGGIRAWAAEVGEYYNAFDGQYGGLWRRNGRPPQMLVGVGFTAQGNFVGSYYRVQLEARNSRAAWILDGIDDDKIGDFGLSGHGAAGFELDRADKRLGTPEHAVVIASSQGHKREAPWVLAPEEQLTHIVTLPGEPAEKLIRADMTFFEAPNNGAVFSTGSITFCGSLPVNSYENNVSRIVKNVLDRFLDPAVKFPLPGKV
jgi:N,N-dimethylformamidase